jgi:hypothetical protein
MRNKIEEQNEFYEALTDGNIQPLSARYIAARLQTENVKKIISVKSIKSLEYKISTDNKEFLVNLHMLDLPDAKISEI